MKKGIKLFVIPMAFMLVSQLIGCNVAKKEIALITDVGDIDDGSFNQGSWEAIKDYCTNVKAGKTYDYYRPFADSDFARNAAIKQAVYKGAKVVVCPGFKFANAINEAQYKYPDVKFILLDSATNDDVLSNCVCVGYQCEYSGYLSGYAVMTDYLNYDFKNGGLKDEYKFGYCGGMATDGVLQFGFGYIQGVVVAAQVFTRNNKIEDSKKPKLNFRHNYAGVFAQSDDAAVKMKGWYADGYKCIFPCGGKLYQSITEAAKDYNRKNGYYDELSKEQKIFEYSVNRDAARWVGVDSDQYTGLKDKHDKNTIYTSALKGLKTTIKTALHYYDEGKWGGENSVIGGAFSTDDVAMKFSKSADGKTTAKQAAESYLASQPLTFKDYDTDIKSYDGIASVDDAAKIVRKKKNSDSVFTDYCAQTKSWTLGLQSQFGKVGKGIEIEKLDYVGIPDDVNDKAYNPDTKIMRGFKNFTIDDYNKAKEETKEITVYGGDGTNLYDKDGNPVTTITKGDPEFMSKSKDYYILTEDNCKKSGQSNVNPEALSSYNAACFDSYPADKIEVKKID